MKLKSNTRLINLTLTAMLSAIAFILMFLEISLPFIPAFIKFDISDMPALIGSFTIGPFYGILIELIKNVLHILIKGSSSAFIGELSNFLLGSVFVFTAGFIYRKSKSKASVLISFVAGAILMGLISLPINYFIVYPAYVSCYNLPLNSIITMYEDILPAVSNKPTGNMLFNCLLIFNLPFTIVKGLADAAITTVILSPIKKVINKAF